MYLFFASLLFLFILEITYFKIANHFNIIDKPNQRSSHTQITLRGGAIIFPIAMIIGISIFQPSLIYIMFGIFAIATISFLDDIITLNNKLRIGVHLLSVSLMLYQIYVFAPYTLNVTTYTFYLIPISFIIIIGIINAYNFMDGINGITVLYSIVSFASIWLVQQSLGLDLLHNEIWLLLLAALLVFGFFNLRKRAKTFAGDVGSISIALLLCYLLINLSIQTETIKWILFLGIYGLDAVATIFCRILRKENIFDAHRSHFYQYLANDKKIDHVIIAIAYALIQGVLNLIVIYSTTNNAYLTFGIIVVSYILIRLKLEGQNRLFKSY